MIPELVSGMMIVSGIFWLLAHGALFLDRRNIGSAIALNLVALVFSLSSVVILLIDWVILG